MLAGSGMRNWACKKDAALSGFLMVFGIPRARNTVLAHLAAGFSMLGDVMAEVGQPKRGTTNRRMGKLRVGPACSCGQVCVRWLGRVTKRVRHTNSAWAVECGLLRYGQSVSSPDE